MRAHWRWPVLRTTWLLIGAAIGLAAALLLVGLAEVVGPSSGLGRTLTLIGCLWPALLIGLLPGVRELEVTAARALLGVTAELVEPERTRGPHRWRTVVLVAAHLVLGLVTATLLVGAVPAAVAMCLATLNGQPVDVFGAPAPVVSGPASILLMLLAVAGCLAATWGLGRLGARLATRLLGPTAADRLQIALARLDAELEHARLARDLHDGIGHALTIIGVQAAAGRRSLSRDPQLAAEALATIEGTSRQALDELDNLLGLLRREPVARTAEPDLDRLPALVETHRSGGMRVEANVHTPSTLPRLVSTTAYRIVAEGLTNAERYAGDGPVQVSVRSDADRVLVQVTSPAGPRTTVAGRTGRGLTGIAERVALFGGRVDAGPSASGDWVVAAVIPYGGSGG